MLNREREARNAEIQSDAEQAENNRLKEELGKFYIFIIYIFLN